LKLLDSVLELIGTLNDLRHTVETQDFQPFLFLLTSLA